jgi:hypothetical protein
MAQMIACPSSRDDWQAIDILNEQGGLKESGSGLFYEGALMVVVLGSQALIEWAGPLNTGSVFCGVTFGDD